MSSFQLSANIRQKLTQTQITTIEHQVAYFAEHKDARAEVAVPSLMAVMAPMPLTGHEKKLEVVAMLNFISNNESNPIPARDWMPTIQVIGTT